jgi:hypothetical protein
MKSWQQLTQNEKIAVIICNKIGTNLNLENGDQFIRLENWLCERGIRSDDYDIEKKELIDQEFWHEKAVKGIYP